ncbi:hypothetical protein IMSAGC020_01515 [Lachnospiraceae bacterium]|nr:hypothetical protein [Lachnospiraceae bacterium]GFI50309.1 hypothetical protein IMSAGC020_01515 [Lachnospiraceae bacterium]
MRKRITVALFVAACLLIGGCGSSSDPNSMANNIPDETESSEEEALSGIDDVELEGYVDIEEMEESEEEKADSDTSAEAKGIVAMLYNAGTFQIVTINPENGEQSVFANFYLGGDSPDFISASKRVSAHTGSFYGNRRDWFSNDYTKMIYTQYDILDTGVITKSHAGWIDRDGEFFDVTAAVGMEHEADFSSPGSELQSACGFKDNMFVFREEDTYYQVPIDNLSSDQVSEIDGDEWRYGKLLYNLDIPSTGLEYPYVTSWIDADRYIADDFLCEYTVNSVIVQTGTDETTEYIPESERNNWSGVLSPDGDTVAFLSISGQYDGTSPEIYTVPLTGGEPSKVLVSSTSDLLFDFTTVSHKDIGMGLSETGKSESERFRCYLLGWE